MEQLQTNPSKTTVYIIFILVVLVWGTAWPVTKIGLYYMPPIWYAAARISIGALTLIAFLGLTRRLALPKRIDFPHIFATGLLLVALFQIFVNIGLSLVDAGRSTILIYTTQIWVIPISYLFFKEHITAYHLWSLFLGMIGVLILFSPAGVNWHDRHAVIGNSILLLSAFTWAINMVIIRYLKWYNTPLNLLPWQLLLGLIPIFAAALYFEPSPVIHWSHPLILSLLYTGVLGTAFGLWGMIVVSKELPIATTSLSLLAIPMLGIISSKLMLNEPITNNMISAMIFIFMGLTLIIVQNRKAMAIKNKKM